MNRTLAFTLAAFAIAAIILAWAFSPTSSTNDSVAELGPALPGLSATLNDLDQLTLSDVEDKLALTRIDGLWQIVGLEGLPVKQGKVREFLLDLAQSALVEAKTDNPKYHSTLGLGDEGTVISLGGDRGLVAGKTVAGGGRFIRRIGADQSYVAKGISVPPLRLKNWTDFDLPVAPKERVTRVDVSDGIAGYSVTVKDAVQSLVDMKDSEALAYDGVLDTVVAGAVFIDFETVKPAADIDWSNAGTSVFYGPGDEDRLTYTIAEIDGTLWLRAAPSGVFTPKTSLNWDAWAFEISDYRKETLLKPRAALLAAAPEPSKE